MNSRPFKKAAARAAVALAGTFAAASVWAAGDVVRIGVLTDLTSPATDVTGVAAIEAVKLAVEDVKGTVAGKRIEVIFADYQNKPDIGATIARRWIDEEGVDVITDVANSAVAIAVGNVVRDKNKVLLAVSPASTALTGENCSPNTVQWVHDSWAMASAAKAAVQAGGKSWFFITADYTLGYDLEKVASATVIATGGTVVGGVKHPLGAPDFASYLLQAQSSGAQVIGVASAFDGVNIMKQAAEFGLTRNKRVKMFMLITTIGEINGAGLAVTKGLQLTTPWYWDQDQASRAFTKRLQERTNGKVTTQHHAGNYSAVTHYLKAVTALNDATDGRKVVEKMKELPTKDPLYKDGTVRADGRKIHPMHLYEVKAPEESKYKYDYLKYVRSVSGDEAFRPLGVGQCAFVKKPG